jgi:hypothetical protein
MKTPERSQQPSESHDVSRSNSLTDLAARIKAEHSASVLAGRKSLTHAINAGRLLNEAKDQLKHGQWLPWLREHCGIPERSCHRYMGLAAYAAESKSADLADLSVADAPAAAAISISKAVEAGEVMLAAQLMLDAPFHATDFVDPREAHGTDWLRTKLFHQLKVPAIAAWCFDVADATDDGRPALRLCPYDELLQAAEVLAPLATADRKHPIKLDSESFDNIGKMHRAAGELQLRAMWLLGGVLNEIQYREHITQARYQRQWDETHRAVMTHLDAQCAALREPAMAT